jgi:serine/threonine-protein kinase
MDGPVAVGTVIAGKIRLERVLGKGAMGVVYAAHHLSLDKPVAVKLLMGDALSDVVKARFFQEARAAAKIESEHIVRVFDVGELDTGAPYIVMEYLEGRDLDALVQRDGPLRPEVAAEYALQVCEALAAAHASGIVHRDLKPANLFLTRRVSGRPLIKVIDFGISRILSASNGKQNLTKTKHAPGSPMFMSPEHIERPREVDTRSDLWSLGVTIYYLLTGAYPFDAETVHQLIFMITSKQPAPLSAHRADLPEGLSAIVMRCLEKQPADRFADVAELASSLADFAPERARISVESAYRTLHSDPESSGLLPAHPPARSDARQLQTTLLATEPLGEQTAGETASQPSPLPLSNSAPETDAGGGAAPGSDLVTTAPAPPKSGAGSLSTQDDAKPLEQTMPRSSATPPRALWPRLSTPVLLLAVAAFAGGIAMFVSVGPDAPEPQKPNSASPEPSPTAVTPTVTPAATLAETSAPALPAPPAPPAPPESASAKTTEPPPPALEARPQKSASPPVAPGKPPPPPPPPPRPAQSPQSTNAPPKPPQPGLFENPD